MVPSIRATSDEIDHWRAERHYWRGELANWFISHYGFALHPLQQDDATVPGLDLVAQIQNPSKSNPDVYFATGYRTVLDFLRELHDHEFAPDRFGRILEFGVGLGRLIRHFVPFSCERFGCDVTADALTFTQKMLGDFVSLSTNALAPPLPYDAASFDFVYANSVFTHIQMSATPLWISELRRVLRPGGVLIATVMEANHYLKHLSPREFDEFELDSGYLEWGSSKVTERFIYMTPRKLLEIWGQEFEILELRHRLRDQSHLIMCPR